jgi:hypothetical protein
MAKVYISQRALLQRINRKLAKEEKKLLTSRSNAKKQEFGNFYIVDINLNNVIQAHIDLEVLGQDLHAIKKGEKYSEEVDEIAKEAKKHIKDIDTLLKQYNELRNDYS